MSRAALFPPHQVKGTLPSGGKNPPPALEHRSMKPVSPCGQSPQRMLAEASLTLLLMDIPTQSRVSWLWHLAYGGACEHMRQPRVTHWDSMRTSALALPRTCLLQSSLYDHYACTAPRTGAHGPPSVWSKAQNRLPRSSTHDQNLSGAFSELLPCGKNCCLSLCHVT